MNFIDVNADRYTTNAAPAKPLEILSAVITIIKVLIFGSEIANQANSKLLAAAIKAQKNNAFKVPTLIAE